MRDGEAGWEIDGGERMRELQNREGRGGTEKDICNANHLQAA